MAHNDGGDTTPCVFNVCGLVVKGVLKIILSI